MTQAPVTVRLARPEDRQQLVEIMRRASLAVESGDVLRRLLDEPEHFDIDDMMIANGQVILAEANGVPVGFASFIAEDRDDVELDGIFVLPDHWRQGIGTLLLEAVERELTAWQATRIRVVAGPDAVPFYQSAGFRVVGEERTPLGPIAPVMAKVIAGRP